MRVWPFALALVGAAFDQAAKAWAEVALRGRAPLPVLDGVLELRYMRNPGAFFGLGATLPADTRRALLCVASLGIVVLVLSLHRRTSTGSTRMHLAIALVLAGVLGNLADRVLRGDVVDFVHLRAADPTYWTTFNLADLWIVLGLAALAWELVRPPAPQATVDTGGGR